MRSFALRGTGGSPVYVSVVTIELGSDWLIDRELMFHPARGIRDKAPRSNFPRRAEQ